MAATTTLKCELVERYQLPVQTTDSSSSNSSRSDRRVKLQKQCLQQSKTAMCSRPIWQQLHLQQNEVAVCTRLELGKGHLQQTKLQTQQLAAGLADQLLRPTKVCTCSRPTSRKQCSKLAPSSRSNGMQQSHTAGAAFCSDSDVPFVAEIVTD